MSTGHWGTVEISGSTPDDLVAFIDTERWNGFASPHLTRESVERLREYLDLNQEGSVRLTWDGEDVLMHEAYYSGEPGYTPDRFTPFVIDGVTTWSVGAWSWAWEGGFPTS